MDMFWIKLTGPNLDSERLSKIFGDFEIRLRPRNDAIAMAGKTEDSRTGRTNPDVSIEIFSKKPDLLSFLKEVERRLDEPTALNIGGVEVWAILERSGQINSELSVEEISCLQRLNATFCWSVILEESE